MQWRLFIGLILIGSGAFAQSDSMKVGIYFPNQHLRSLRTVGILLTTTSSEVTEELQFRIPAIDFHFSNRIHRKFYGSGRAIVQGLQNHVSAGVNYRFEKGRYRCSLENTLGYWFGYFHMEGFKLRGNGWLDYPSITVGRETFDRVFLSVKMELILNLGYRTFVANNLSASNHKLYNGQRISIVMEQPFYKKQWLMLGFGFLYADLNWQTWVLHENFKRNSFYPQIFAGFIL